VIHKVYAVVIFVLVVIAAVTAWQWGEHLKAAGKRDAQLEASEKQRLVLEQQNAQLAQSIEALRSQNAQVMASLEAQRRQVQASPEQAIRVVHDVLPQAQMSNVPDAPSVLNQKDAVKLADFKLQCTECDQSLAEVRAEDKVKDEQIGNLQTEKLSLQRDLETAKNSHKIGFWRKFGCTFAGAAGAGLGSAVGKTDSGKMKGAAIGAGLGATLCYFTR
jgi:hypothetical protein